MNRVKQFGMSTYVLLIVLLVSGFFLLCAFRLVPAYSENYYIVSALKSLAESHPADLAELKKSQVKQELNRFYMLNNIRSEGAQSIEVERKKGRSVITVAYEVRVPIMGNVDAVMSFNNVLDSDKPEECCSVSEE